MRLNIKNSVDSKGLNKHQLSKLMQVGYPAACSLYNGDTNRIFFDTLEKLCLVLECTPNDILESDDVQLNDLINKHKSNSTNKSEG